MPNIYRTMRRYTQQKLKKQNHFPELECIKSLYPPKVKAEDNLEPQEAQEPYFSPKDKTKIYKVQFLNDTLYHVTSPKAGMLLLTEAEVNEFFDVSILSEQNLKLSDAPMEKIEIMNKEGNGEMNDTITYVPEEQVIG